MDAKVIYKKYDKQVQEYMDNVIKCLEADYGKIPESWRVSLDLIADNYSIYLKAKADVDKNGLQTYDNYGRPFRNQCLSVMNQAQTQLKDLLKSFALTPMSRTKMNHFNSDTYDTDNYLESLLN